MTLVRDAQEEDLVRAALGVLGSLGAPLAVSDGGSPASFTDFLATLPGVRIVPPRGRGLVAQVTASLDAAAATGAPFVLYTEPDKHLFFRDHVRDFIDRALNDPTVGIVVAGRSSAALATFPEMQRRGESTINQLTGESVGIDGDYSYGPFLLRRELVTYMHRVPADAGWGWRHYIFTVASRLGYTVMHVEGAYTCPEDQRVEDDGQRVHRLRQLAQNVQGLVLGLTTPIGAEVNDARSRRA